MDELSLSYTCGLSKDLSSSLSTKTSLVCHMPDWLLLLSASQDLCFIFSRGNSAADNVRLERCKELHESLKPEPVRFCEVASPVEPMVDFNTLRNKGRRVGIQNDNVLLKPRLEVSAVGRQVLVILTVPKEPMSPP